MCVEWGCTQRGEVGRCSVPWDWHRNIDLTTLMLGFNKTHAVAPRKTKQLSPKWWNQDSVWTEDEVTSKSWKGWVAQTKCCHLLFLTVAHLFAQVQKSSRVQFQAEHTKISFLRPEKTIAFVVQINSRTAAATPRFHYKLVSWKLGLGNTANFWYVINLDILATY